MDRNAIEAIVLNVLSTILKRPLAPNADHDRKSTPGWDSLKQVEILFAIEDELAVEFSDQELASLDSVAKIVAAVEAKHAA